MTTLIKTPFKIGSHLRLKNSYTELIAQARDLNCAFLQFFLTSSTKKNKYLPVTPEDRVSFLAHRPSLQKLYIHSSYWINPASSKASSAQAAQILLAKELRIAEQLECSALVLHPGSVSGYDYTDHQLMETQGIENVARALNSIMKKFPYSNIILENTAHGNVTIGNTFKHFKQIKERSAYPERLGFCLDFAHAHAFGYKLQDAHNFYQELEESVKKSDLWLLHLNDTAELCGSKKDSHLLPGQGLIGKENLIKLLTHPFVQGVPTIIEPPVLSSQELNDALLEISNWL